MPDPSSITVLIIDDNDVSRSMLRHILANEKYRVVGEAGNGRLGLELAERLKPNIVCLDINMPAPNGIEVLRQLKETLPQAEVLMVTGNNDRNSVMEAMQLGAAGYIVKPFNPTTLLRTLEQAVAKLRTDA
ncbi:response regulator transcription factor [Noviherbaspirillum denitrificans]|uniref:Chemotaxis protein n=1 Tax=Noviherbaspirillum denitrificans TaxID=1968433 RepID=A0A254TIF0_9BURK|nr:response regulator [Noviherbaspirillum denitrificans]OWW22399.1 chemotaxis protein [Noviherbaspirillum denitrificans]